MRLCLQCDFDDGVGLRRLSGAWEVAKVVAAVEGAGEPARGVEMVAVVWLCDSVMLSALRGKDMVLRRLVGSITTGNMSSSMMEVPREMACFLCGYESPDEVDARDGRGSDQR